jgi:undecaprenyl-diphosphatase
MTYAIFAPATVARLALSLGLLGPVLDLDHWVQSAVQRARQPELDRVVRVATDVGKPTVIVGALLGLAVFGGPLGVATARTAVMVLVPTNVAVEGLKRAVNRRRPEGDHQRSNSSFPSSHAANAFALAAVFARRWRPAAPAFWTLAAAVAWSRLYLNRHFLSDIVCGAMVGVAVAWWICSWIEGRGNPAARRRT